MKSTNQCPKCNSTTVYIRETQTLQYGTYIPLVRSLVLKRNTANISFYICGTCGYVEQYIEEKNLGKVKKYLGKDNK